MIQETVLYITGTQTMFILWIDKRLIIELSLNKYIISQTKETLS